jgi:2-iminobutanoate/2-iminopropanoate deaminase
MADRSPVETSDAPAAIGPYSQAIAHGDLLFCSGQIPLDPATGEYVAGSLGEETTRCLENLAAVCAAAGSGLDRALRLTIYTTRLDGFAEINESYGAFFAAAPPARAAIGVAALPKGAQVEIDAIVALDPAR